jgi:hypothetical protein
VVIGSSGGSPTTGRTPTGAVDLGEASGVVGSAREAAHRCGGELGWQLGFGLDFYEIEDRRCTIYMGKMA